MCGIYKITNLINGKIYIGKSIDIQRRFRSHINESLDENKPSYHHTIHRAMRKYGSDNFSFDILEECAEDKLNEREMYWISFFDCCVLDGSDKGYNMTRGGDGSSSLDVNKIRELWDNELSINEIAERLHCDRHAVSRHIKCYENFNEEENKRRKYSLISKHRGESINQYDLDGNFICQYESILDASEKTGVGYRTICSNIQGQSNSAGGFQWTYQDNAPPGKHNVKGNGYKVPVVQLDSEYNFIKEFQSMKDAAQEVGLLCSNSLYYALKNKEKMIKGFHWMYKTDYEADRNAHNTKRND